MDLEPFAAGNVTGGAEDASDESTSISLPVQVAMGVGLYSLALVTCVGNAMVIHAIRTEKRLRKVSNFFIMSLAVADLAVGVFVMPVSAVYALKNKWYLGIWLCEMWLSADYVASTASIFNLVVLSLDRYWSITSPLKYLRRRTKKRASCMIAAAWALSFLWILPVTSWHTMVNPKGMRTQPDHVCDTEFAHNVTFKVTAAVANFYVPTLSMLYIYGRIFCTIRRRSRSNELGQVSNSTESWNPTNSRRKQQRERPSRLVASLPVCTTSDLQCCEDSNCDSIGPQSENDTVTQTIDAAPSATSATFNRSPRKQKRLRFSRFRTSSSKSALQWCRRSTPSKKVERVGLFDGRTERRNDCSVFDFYQSLTLLEVNNQNQQQQHQQQQHQQSTQQGATASANLSAASSVSHYVNVRVQVEYDAEDPTEAEMQKTPTDSEPGQSTEVGEVLVSRRHTAVFSTASTGAESGLISRKERKAARQLGVIVCAFIVCWLPYFIVFLVVAVCPNCIDGTLYNVTLWLGYFNSTLNPVLYSLCNANFRRAFTKMLAIKRCPGATTAGTSNGRTQHHTIYPSSSNKLSSTVGRSRY